MRKRSGGKWVVVVSGMISRTEDNAFRLFKRDYEDKVNPWVVEWESFFGGEQQMRFRTMAEAKEHVRRAGYGGGR